MWYRSKKYKNVLALTIEFANLFHFVKERGKGNEISVYSGIDLIYLKSNKK